MTDREKLLPTVGRSRRAIRAARELEVILRSHDVCAGCEHCDDARVRSIASLCSFHVEHRDVVLAERTAMHPPARWLPLVGGKIESRSWLEWHWRHPRYEPARHIPASMRREVIARDGNVCGICGLETNHNDIHIDHVVPFAHGGPSIPTNLQVAHSFCNIAKGARVQ